MMRDRPGYEQPATPNGEVVWAPFARDGHCVAIIVLRFEVNVLQIPLAVDV
jgi:hypothetical protein